MADSNHLNSPAGLVLVYVCQYSTFVLVYFCMLASQTLGPLGAAELSRVSSGQELYLAMSGSETLKVACNTELSLPKETE